MKSKKVISKIFTLPVALLSIFTPAIATEDNIDCDLILSVPAYVEIMQDVTSVTDSQANVLSPNSLKTNSNIAVKYNVLANGSAKVYVYAEAQTTTGTVNALYGNSLDSMTLVLTKNDGSALDAAVSNCVGNSVSASENVGAIAFTFNSATPTNNAVTTVADNHIEYDVNQGKTVLSYTLGDTVLANTFSVKDTSGVYKATLYVSTVEP